MRLSRRNCLSLMAAGGASLGLGRLPLDGELKMSVPWSLARLDPHDSNDIVAAVFGHAVAEPLFAVDQHGRTYPTLAAERPVAVGSGSKVRLRPGLRSSIDRPLSSRDLLWSLQRARRFGAHALMADHAPPRAADGWVVFEDVAPDALAEMLSSPLTAILPRSFSPGAPDGTGAFRARFNRNGLELRRNPWAPRGPAYLERIRVQPAADLAEALRAFEAGHVDLGWLGRGLHAPRPDTELVDASEVGWVVLHSGRGAGRWGAPGTAASLLANIPAPRLERFGLGPLPNRATPTRYAGPSCTLLARDDCPYLLELGRSLSQLLSSSGHPITLESSSAADLHKRKRSGDFCFLLDVVRHAGSSVRARQLSLLHEANPQFARRAPKLAPGLTEAEMVERTTASLSLAVVGQLRVVVARPPDVRRVEGWELGNVFRVPPG